MSETDELAALRTIPMFAGLDEASLRRIAESSAPFEVEAGHVLVEHGQPGSGMFVLSEGTVEVDLPGHEPLSLGPGEFFGELSLLTDMMRMARVHATSHVRGLAIGRVAFEALLREEPRVAAAMLPVLARRLAALENEAT